MMKFPTETARGSPLQRRPANFLDVVTNVAEGTGTPPDLQTVARLLGGRINGDEVLCPGPSHSAIDQSLSVKIDASAPDGFLVHSFSSDDPIVCRDYVRAVDPGKYVPIRLIVNDGTIERLAELLQARPHGIVLVRDELAALFMNMSRYSGGQDDEFWLESWNGEPHTVERMGRMLSVDHLLIGVVGGMQPDKLVASFKGDHDGKYARVLFAWPDEPGWLGLNNDATEIDIDIQNIISRILTLAEFTQEGELIPYFIGLDAEAAAEFAQFAQFAHQEKNAFEGREREWFAKATAHVLRLVNTLTYVEWALTTDTAKPVAVNKTTMQAAIRLVRDYFWPHARACLRLIGLTESHSNARRVLLWLRAKGKPEVSREEIRRDALSQRLDANETTALLTALSKSGWLREEVTEPGPQGGKPARRWLVNPKLLTDPVAQTALTAETPS
jgi:hypothetical protein